MKATEVLNDLRRRFPNEPEYLQAVEEVITTIEDAYNEHPEFDRYNLIERLCIPDRIFSFRVSWIDDKGRRIMADIHAQCERYGREPDGFINYVKGANTAGFMKVAKAMMAQGVL